MQTSTTNELSCSVFGHNLERSSLAPKETHELICKTCKSKVFVNATDEYNILPIKNRKISTALRQLFLLNTQYSHQRISI